MQPNLTDLTPQQHQAVELFTRGMPVRCIADAVGVSRETLWHWRQKEPFRNALQNAKRMRYDQLREQAAELLRLSMLSITRELKYAEDSKMRNPLETAFKTLQFIERSGLLHEEPDIHAVYNAPAVPQLTSPSGEV